MPWMIVKNEDSYCVHKKHDDDSAGELVPGGCHASSEEAEAHMRALYANVAEMHGDDHDYDDEMSMPADEMNECMKKHMADGKSMEEAKAACAESRMAELSPARESYTNGTQDEDDPSLELIAEIGMATRMSKAERPNIPFAPGLKAEDFVGENGERPTFIELKIAESGRKSKEGLLYDDALVDTIVEQINRKRVGGIFGHTNPENPYENPEPKVMWVGAIREGNTAWAKGWVREMNTARWVQDIKRVGGTVGTSIWGRGAKELKDNAVRLKKFVLERLDLTDDVERASLSMDGRFALVHEMTNTTEGKPVTIEELKAALAEHKPEVILNILPAETLERVNEMVAQKNRVLTEAGDQQLITQLASENEQARTLIAEMQTADKTQKETITKLTNDLLQHDLEATVRKATDWVVTTEPGKNKLNALRSHLKMGLVAEMNAGEPLWDAMCRVMDNNNYKAIVEMTKKELGGGALTIQVHDQRNAEFARPTDEQIADSRARLGI